MRIEDLIAGFKEKGLTDEQIKEELVKIKTDIEAFLNPQDVPEDKEKEVKEEVETDEEKQHRVFGI